MKNAEDMTPDELRALADQKEAGTKRKPVKRGVLKHDLYFIDSNAQRDIDELFGSYTLTWDDMHTAIKDVTDHAPVLCSGSEFLCYLVHGIEKWWDNEDEVAQGIECEDSNWAEEHLEDIVDV